MSEKILVISTYPPQGSLYGNKYSAVASYTKNTLTSMGSSFLFTVLADELKGENSYYREDNVTVRRCWTRGSLSLLYNLLVQIIKSNEKKIIFCFEWGMFGRNIANLILLPPFLLITSLIGKKIFFVSHGVLIDYSLIAPQLGQTKERLKVKIYGLGLKLLYASIILTSYRIIVFEEYLKKELLELINKPEKIITISHGVEEPKKIISQEQARKKLKINNDELIIISFGFVIWYKGSDWLIRTMDEYFKKNKKTKIRLFMVGGESQVHKSDPVYRKYLNDLYKIEKGSKGRIIITGFIPEEKIGLYFSACDLAILPYRILVSASGPLSFVFSYKKPFLLSDNLKGYCLSRDFEKNLEKAKLGIKEIYFSLNNQTFIEKVRAIIQDKSTLKQLKEFSALMHEERKWSNIGKEYEKVIINN